jgi:uncharacterized protein
VDILRFRKFLPLAFLLLAISTHAQDKESQAYCTYVQEQAQAEAIRLRTPYVESGVTQQPIVGGIPQKFAGVKNSLSDDRKSSLVKKDADADCKLYTATTVLQKRILYAIPQMEQSALQNRILLLDAALAELNETIKENNRKLAAKDVTVQSAYMLDSAKSKLVMDKSSTTLALSEIVVPEDLDEGSLLALANEKQSLEAGKQLADNRVSKQQDWDIQFAIGARKDAFPLFAGKSTGAYGNFTFTYDLGARARTKHLATAAEAYADYKELQYNDAAQEILVLKKEILSNISAQEESLQRLKTQEKSIQEYLAPVKDVDTATAIQFRNQLFVDSLALRVEIGNAQFRLDGLKKYFAENF